MMSTSVSYAMSASAVARRICPGRLSVRGVCLPCRHHRHASNPAGDSFVEFLLHGEVAARGKRAEGGNPSEDFVGAAARRLAHLVGVERVGPPDLAATQNLHEFFVPFRIERLAGSLAGFGENARLEH